MPLRGDLQIALLILAASLVGSSFAVAANDAWDNNPGGNWENGANWVDGSTPGVNDTATFNLAQSYLVAFAADPAVIQALSVTAGSVTMQSIGGARTLNLTAGAGSQDIALSGATTTLTLGTSNNPLSLNAGDDLSIQTGATLAVSFGSDVVANDLSGSGLNGTLRCDGNSSTLTLSGAVANLVGVNGTGALIFQNASTGNTINGSLGLASTGATNTIGNLSLTAGSTLTLGGNLTLANQNATGQVAGVTIVGTNSALTQTGASTISIGSVANGTATISIGTTTSGGNFATGTGLFTINKTGIVTIGSGTNVGTLLANGNLTINGGLLQKSNANSVFDLASGRTVTIQGGGRLSLAGASAVDSNQIFNITGANSKLDVTSTSALAISGGAQVNLASAAALTVGGKIDVANGATGNGTLTLTGNGSTATAGSVLSAWASGGATANVSLSDKAVATFSGGIDVANSTTAGTTATVNVLSGAVLNTGNLNFATVGGTTTASTLSIQGTDSHVVQAGAASLTLGHASEGTAAINIGTTSDGGSLTTGSGLLKINKTGTVTVGSGSNGGTLEVLGNITVDGGIWQEGSDNSSFAWAAGKTFAVQNGGRVHFASIYLTAANAQHVISGTNSKFEVVGAIQLRGAAQIGVNTGGTISAGEFNVGGGGTAGSFIVDGAGSAATGGNVENHWGGGGAANVTFSNQAAVTLGGSVSLGESAATLVNVLSGADLAVGDLSLASIGGTASATLNVLGIGTTMSLAPASDLVIGHAANGSATINIEDGGTLAVGNGGTTSVLGTGTVNLASGTADLRSLSVVGGNVNVNGGRLVFSTLNVTGGAIKFNSGRIEQANNLAADDTLLTTLLGATHELAAGRTLAAAGGTAIVSTKLDLNGGRLEGNSLNLINSGLNATVFRLRSGGIAQFSGGATLAAGTNTFIEEGSTFIASAQISQASELQLAGTGRIAGAALTNSGLVTGSGRVDANLDNQSTGQIRLATDERLLVRGSNHQNNGLIDIDGGEFEVATGMFVNGTANPVTATIAARNATLRFTGGLTNAASIVCSEGNCNLFGNVTNVTGQPTIGHIVITADSQATFFDDVDNQGTIQVSAAGLVESTALFLGSLTGNGVTGNGSVFLEGDVRPGSSVGTMAFGGDLSVGSGAVVKIELAGTSPGTQFDRITVEQSLSLGGTLEVMLTGGFTPAAGQSFDLIDWGTRIGAFAALQLPAIPGLAWNTSQLYTTGVLSVDVSTLLGDFNGNGIVDTADYTVWRNGLGSVYTQSDYTIWKSHFGQTNNGGGAIASNGQSVPESSSVWLLLLATTLTAATRWQGKSDQNCRQIAAGGKLFLAHGLESGQNDSDSAQHSSLRITVWNG